MDLSGYRALVYKNLPLVSVAPYLLQCSMAAAWIL